MDCVRRKMPCSSSGTRTARSGPNSHACLQRAANSAGSRATIARRAQSEESSEAPLATRLGRDLPAASKRGSPVVPKLRAESQDACGRSVRGCDEDRCAVVLPDKRSLRGQGDRGGRRCGDARPSLDDGLVGHAAFRLFDNRGQQGGN